MAESREKLDHLYEDYLAAGQEGQMIRTNEAYENKRSKTLLKRKTFDDAEFTILGMEEGTGNRAGTCGAMHFQNTAGKTFKSNVKGTWEFTEDLWLNRKKYMGRLATIRFFGYTPGDKIPRFPYVVGIRDGE
jgi:DNA ligase-1